MALLTASSLSINLPYKIFGRHNYCGLAAIRVFGNFFVNTSNVINFHLSVTIKGLVNLLAFLHNPIVKQMIMKYSTSMD
ncbi:MAG: hypothetical protein J7K66_06790 [Anaerolineaceae bacterium]|nr:hypothetical protein [Anaerolineaceae bacterium]